MLEKIKYYSLNINDDLFTDNTIIYLLNNTGYVLVSEIKNDFNYEIKLYKKGNIRGIKQLFMTDIYITYIKADNVTEDFIKYIKKGAIKKDIKKDTYIMYFVIETNNYNQVMRSFIKNAVVVPQLHGKFYKGICQVPIVIDNSMKKVYIGNYYLHYWNSMALYYKRAVETLFEVLEEYYKKNNFEFMDNVKSIKIVDNKNEIFGFTIFIVIIILMVILVVLFIGN